VTKEDVLTTNEIAAILRLAVSTVQRKSWREQTGCPLKKRGKRLYVLVEDFRRWLKEYYG